MHSKQALGHLLQQFSSATDGIAILRQPKPIKFIFHYYSIAIILTGWGINKFRKFGMDPNLIDNMEVEDFLSRIPSDPELEMLKEPSRHQKRE